MKKYYFTLLFLLFFFGCSKNSVNWFSGNLHDAVLLADNKIIMIDFYTDW